VDGLGLGLAPEVSTIPWEVQALELCVHVRGGAATALQPSRMAESSASRGPAYGPRARSSAYVRSSASRRWREFRGSPGSARASLGPNHHPLQCAGYRTAVGRCELDLRATADDRFANSSAGCRRESGTVRQNSGSNASGKKQGPGALTLTE